ERLAAEAFAGWQRRKAEDEKADQERGSDLYALQAAEFRDDWIATRSRNYGSFEDITKIPPMRFTDKPAPRHIAYPCDTLQIFSARVAEIRGDLHWPLRVFGMVALRDPVDYNRNVIFHRTRDNCTMLHVQDSFLELTGPTRAVTWPDTVTIEAVLKVKGTVESEDRDLSFLAVPIMRQATLHSYLLNRDYTSMLSTLEFTLGHIVFSTEATISVRVIDGSWRDEFHALFAASTTSIYHKKIVLLYSKDEKIVLTDDGNIKLSPSVASVEIEGKLKVSVRAWAASDNNVVEDEFDFTPKEYDRSYGILDVGFCKMEVTVAWSLISS
ncbi:hypothetical protein PVAP13_2KG475205, partial [Panicum virgatum]